MNCNLEKLASKELRILLLRLLDKRKQLISSLSHLRLHQRHIQKRNPTCYASNTPVIKTFLV